MPPRQRRAEPLPVLAPGQLLDWRDASHWSNREAPCRYCGGPTRLLDEQRQPAHKTCAERDGVRRGQQAAGAYRQGRKQP